MKKAPKKKKKAATKAPSTKFWFDSVAADRAVLFFERYLKHIKGRLAGEPFKLEGWQAKVVRDVFGWKRPNGMRRYRIVYVEIPRKNGKSTWAAGFGDLLTFADNEPGAEVYSAAGDREQASIVFNLARDMVDASPALRKRAQIYRRSIVVPRTQSSYKVLSADAFTKHGLNAHGVIFDELHVQPNRDLWDVLTTSVGAREQPLVIAITTAGYDRNSICWEQHDYATKVLSGEIVDESYYAVIYAADEKDDWTDPKVWRKANPNLGVSVSEEFLSQECERAKKVATYENTFRRLFLNQWTEQKVRWLQMSVWEDSKGDVDAHGLRKMECWGGLDLASTTDIAAFVLTFAVDGVFKWLPYFWVPEERMMERAKKDRVPYDVWVKQGLMKATPGDVIDYKVIIADILKLREQFDIREIAFDRWGATKIMQDLTDEGLTMVPFGQGFASMSAPSKEVMNLLLQKKLHHGGNAVMRWMAGNVVMKSDPADNVKPDKAKSTSRIDGIVAGIMSLDRAIRHGGESGISVYEDRGLRQL